MFPEGRFLEFLLAGVIALIVVGPKDLPILLRKLGQFMAKVRSMAAEFRASFDEMARQSELDELRKEVEAMRNAQFSDIAAHAGAPEVAQTFEELSQGLTDVGVDLHPTYTYTGQENEGVTIATAPKARARKPAGKKAPAKTTAAKKAPAPKTPAKTSALKTAAQKTPAQKTPAAPPAKKAPAKETAPATVTAERPRARKAAGTVS
jgi:sec-independent protein translocase protein TatB